jgi:hypothetical protein
MELGYVSMIYPAWSVVGINLWRAMAGPKIDALVEALSSKNLQSPRVPRLACRLRLMTLFPDGLRQQSNIPCRPAAQKQRDWANKN